MPSGKVFVLKQDIGENSDLDLDEVRSFLSADECDRAERFKYDIHRFRFIRGRGYLRKILAEATDQDPTDLEFQYGKNGKPELVVANFVFNLSHTSDLAVLAYSFDLDDVGVDVELLDRKVEFVGLCEHYFTDEEQEWVLAPFLTLEEQKKRFFEVWTAKEARMKIFGEGLKLDPRAIHVQLSATKPTGFSAPLPIELSLQSFAMEDDNAVAAITATADFEIEWVKQSF